MSEQPEHVRDGGGTEDTEAARLERGVDTPAAANPALYPAQAPEKDDDGVPIGHADAEADAERAGGHT